MKILMLTDRLAIGGAETHIYELTKALRAQGHTVELASAGGTYADKMVAEGWVHHSLPFTAKTPQGIIAARRALALLLRRGHFTIVHAHARQPAFLAEGVCRRYAIPFFCTAHWVFNSTGWRRHLTRWGLHTFAVSSDIANYLQTEYAVARENITTIRNGIDTNHFSPSAHTGGDGILHISRLDTGRSDCAAALLRLAPRLLATGNYRYLTIVGDGDQFPRLAAQAALVNRKAGFSFVRMPGAVTDVRPYLCKADLFIGVSRAALEAMSVGLPVILAGDEGYLSIFGPQNAAEAEVGNLCCRGAGPLTDQRLYADIQTVWEKGGHGPFGRRFVEARYSIAAMASAVFSVYRRYERPTPCVICGYYGARNTGDDTVLSALKQRLRQEGFSPLYVIGRHRKENPYSTQGRFLWGRRGAILRPGTLFVLGGGNLLQNETSGRSLLYYTAMLRRAKRAGCRTILLGGVGKLDAVGQEQVRRAITDIDGFLLRTPQDIAYVRALGAPEKPLRLLPDGALWTRASGHLPANLPDDNICLLALRGHNIVQGLTIATWAKGRGMRIAIAIMQPHADEEAAYAVKEAIADAVILPPLSGGQWVAFLGRCRLVYTMRLHMLIFAAVAGVPAVARADADDKMAAFVEYMASAGGGAWCRAHQPEDRAKDIRALCESVLANQPSQKEHAACLARLRAGGEDFSFADFITSLV